MRHARGKHGVGHGVVGYAPVTIERCEAAGVQSRLAVELKQREPFAGQPVVMGGTIEPAPGFLIGVVVHRSHALCDRVGSYLSH